MEFQPDDALTATIKLGSYTYRCTPEVRIALLKQYKELMRIYGMPFLATAALGREYAEQLYL